jgi:superfamily II DNA or RNA helicase
MSDLQETLKKIRDVGDNPTLPVPPCWNPQFSLRRYQRVGVSHLLGMMRFVLGDPTGAGKTIQALYAWGLYKSQRPSHLMVITTASAVNQWGEECDRFLLDTPTVITPGERSDRQNDRFKAYTRWVESPPGCMLSLNWSQFVRDWDFFAESRDLWSPHTWVVLDEVQKCRTPKSKVYRTTVKLSDMVPRIHGMTATLVKNRAHDALHIFNLMVPGTMSLAFFNRKYVTYGRQKVPLRTGKGGGRRLITVKRVEGYKNLDEFARKVSHLYLARTDDQLDIERPRIQTITRSGELNPFHRRVYHDAEQGYFLENCESDISAANSALTHAQIAAASPEHFLDHILPLEVDVDSVLTEQVFRRPEYKAIQDHNSKLSLLMDLLENDLEDDPVIIYSPFATSIVHLKRALSKYNPVHITGAVPIPERDIARHAFQDGKTNIILVTDAGGEALNLQRAKHVVFYSLPWDPGRYVQVAGRARRFGSLHPYIGIYNLIMRDTVDELVAALLQEKFGPFDQILRNRGSLMPPGESLSVAVARRLRRQRIRGG